MVEPHNARFWHHKNWEELCKLTGSDVQGQWFNGVRHYKSEYISASLLHVTIPSEPYQQRLNREYQHAWK